MDVYFRFWIDEEKYLKGYENWYQEFTEAKDSLKNQSVKM